MPKRRTVVLVTDAWHPQVNGVVQTWTYMQRELAALGHDLRVIDPSGSRAIAVPGEPEVLLSVEPARHLARALGSLIPACLHIATEGPLGWAARALARRRRWSFTTSFHTRFPEYLKTRFGIPAAITLAVLRRFHRDSRAVLVPNDALRRELRRAGFARTRLWGRGVDGELFQPGARDRLDLPRPILLYVGRVSPEKNLTAFLELEFVGSRVVVGDGPERARLQTRYPQVIWLGRCAHEDLPSFYDAADVFVFPSRSDTFGLVMLEAMACGCPVAAYPVPGPLHVVTPGISGALDEDLRSACLAALRLDRSRVRHEALRRSWRTIAQELVAALVPVGAGAQNRVQAVRA
ncbi:MAG TPA: glycosyltransferase family 1 protein [Burkholderiaceae bacterium]|nr:glycosyltransferase family 1 protein [Burkholderiaceae bacterium]